MYGSRDSAKSYFAAQKVIIDTMNKEYSRYILVRKIYADIKDSQFQTIKDIVTSYGLYDYFHFTENPLKIIFKRNGNMILSRGLDKEHKTKSIKDPTGVWYEEMNEIKFNDFLKTTTSLRGGIIQEIATFNPEMETDWINKYFFPPKETYEKPNGNFHFVNSIRKDTTILHTTYKDNKYCTQQSVDLLESFKNTDENYYKIYTLGLWGGVLEGLIYKNWSVVDNVNGNAEFIAYGLDFGYTNHETGIVKIYTNGNDLYVKEVAYGKEMSNELIASVLKNDNCGNNAVVADSAEPKSIARLFELGINIFDAIKGANSVSSGIERVQSYNLKITSDSINVIHELKHYCWKINRNDEILNEPIKKYDHLLDAVRYVVQTKIMVKPILEHRMRLF